MRLRPLAFMWLAEVYKGRENPRVSHLFLTVWFMPGSFLTVLFAYPVLDISRIIPGFLRVFTHCPEAPDGVSRGICSGWLCTCRRQLSGKAGPGGPFGIHIKHEV